MGLLLVIQDYEEIIGNTRQIIIPKGFIARREPGTIG